MAFGVFGAVHRTECCMLEDVKRYGLTMVIFLTGLMAGIIVQTVMAESASVAAPEPGASFIGLTGDAVMALSFTTPAVMVTAQRSQESARFAVQMTYADGRAPRHCVVSPTLDGRLALLTPVSAIRQIPIDVVRSDYPVRVGVLELRDGSSGSGLGPMIIHAGLSGSSVAMVTAGYAGEVSIGRDLFGKLETLCAAVGKR